LSQLAARRPVRLRDLDGARAYWTCQVAGWGFYLVRQLPESHDTAGFRAGMMLEALFAACFGVVLTHGFRRFIAARGWLSLDRWALLPRALVAPVVLAVVFVAPLWFIECFILRERAHAPGLVELFAIGRWTRIFGVWEVLYIAITLHLESTRELAAAQQVGLTSALQASQLRSLESQLNPHFLFNALNTVRALIPDEPARAQAAVTQMASILRHALGAGRDNLVTFESEMSVVDDYLAIELLRLGDRLRVERVVEPAALRAQIPAMLLQTLVENAVKHGIAELREGGLLAIHARIADGAMVLTVDNPRPPVEESTRSMETNNGIGLANASERLRLLFGGEATLEMDLSRPRRATARVRIPVAP
jgi:hypothetical protein